MDTFGLWLSGSGNSFAAFGLDERTIARCQRESGHQCGGASTNISCKLEGCFWRKCRPRGVGYWYRRRRRVWLASARFSVSSRLWLGGVVQIRRDRCLIWQLLEGVRACGVFEDLLLCTDGLAAYPKQALKVFTQSFHSKFCVNPSARASEDVPGSFCPKVSW